MSDLPIKRDGELLIVVLQSKLTLSDVPQLQSLLKQQIDAGALEVVFDFSATSAIDSSGLGLLIATHNSLGPKGGKVRLLEVPAEIFEMLSNMRLAARLNAQPAA